MPKCPISVSGLNRNPQNICIYPSGYDPAPSLTSNIFSIFEMASRVGPRNNLHIPISIETRNFRIINEIIRSLLSFNGKVD